ncbi:hypothetical protein [Leptospira fainei]|uniref:hypothetical protein n=1 Tax=Leptospira fainei TaxID=48782 RepID=UPI000586C948|nr:hypothetical protein [Leptospira fainei]
MYWIFVSGFLFVGSLSLTLARFPVEIYWNPDALYLPTLLTDILHNGGSLRGWSLASSPYIFPDLPLVFLLSVLTKQPFWALVSFSILQASFFVWALGRFLRTLEPQVPAKYSYSFSLLTASFLLLVSEKFPILYLFLLPAMHTSAFLATLWAWPYLYNERTPRFFFFPILSLLVMSDRILLLELYLTAALAWTRRYGSWGTIFPQLSLRFFLSGVLGFGLHTFLRTFLSMEASSKISVIESFRRISEDLIRWASQGDLPGIFFILAVIAGIWALFRGKERGFSFGFAAYLQLILLGIAPMAGLYTDEYSLRYCVPAFYLAPALFGTLILSRDLGKRKNSRNFAMLGIIIGLSSLMLLGPLIPEGSWGFQGIPKPPEVKCVDSLSETENFVLVLTDGKKAKRILVYSDKNVRALSVDFSTLEGSHSLSNREWYIFPPEGPFAVLPEGLGEARIRSFYGEPTKILECPNTKKRVLIYEDTVKIRTLLQRPFQKTK